MAACVDDSPAAVSLVAVAVRWAELLGEPCAVLTVPEDAPEPVTGRPVRRRFGPDGDAEEYLGALIEPFRADGHQVEPVVRYDPVSVWGGLYRYLNDHPAALVATNTRSWTGARRMVFGSVAATIVRHSPAPVLVAPRPDGPTPDER